MRSPSSNRRRPSRSAVRRSSRRQVSHSAVGRRRRRRPALRLRRRRGIVAAAQAVLTTLDEAGRAKVQFPFDGPQKTKWSNLPSRMFQREGIRLADLTAPQRTAVDTLLSTALSRDGYRKVKEIMRADGVLGRGQAGRRRRPRRRGGGPRFAEDEYFLAFLGTPSVTAPWMLQFGGHHLAINLTMAGSQASMAPSLPATQPATYKFEGRTDPSAGQRERQGVCADQRAE